MDKLQKKIAEFYYANIYNETQMEFPGFIKRSSLLCFVLNGFLRLLAVFIISNVLLSAALWAWSDALIKDRWVGPFFDSGIMYTDCVSTIANLTSILYTDEGKTVVNEATISWSQDEIEWLYDQSIVDKVYGFEVGFVDLDYNYDVLTLEVGTPETFEMLNYEVTGSSLNTDPDYDPEYPEVLLSGSQFADYRPGDIVTLTIDDADYEKYFGIEYLSHSSPKPLQARVAGKLTFPYQSNNELFYITSESPYFSMDTYSKVFMVYNKSNLKKLADSGIIVHTQHNDHYITYKDGTTDEQITTFRKYLNSLYRVNTYNYISPDNIEPTNKYFGLTPTRPAPLFIQAVLPLLLATICAFLLIIAMITMIKTISESRVIVPKDKIVISDIVKTSLIISLASFVMPVTTLVLRCISSLQPSYYGSIPFMAYVELLTCPHMLKMYATTIFMMLMMIIPSIVFSIRKLKASKHSAELTTQSYTYREPEYYTAGSYSSNYFDQADYNLINKREPEDIVRAVSGGDESNDNNDDKQ